MKTPTEKNHNKHLDLLQKYKLHIITNGFTEVKNKKIINSNLRPKKILDTFIKDEIIYISYVTRKDN